MQGCFRDANNPSDNPNWFVIPRLANAGASVQIVPPVEAMPPDPEDEDEANAAIFAAIAASSSA
jgi:hypothetical protein